MLAKRIIPCLDVTGGRVVKGINFVGLRDAGDPVELAARYNEQGADELVFLDITASHERRETIVDLARRTADNVFIPFTIGGGIRSVEDAQAVLDAGADKVAVNSAAVKRPELLNEMSEQFGAQCLSRRALSSPLSMPPSTANPMRPAAPTPPAMYAYGRRGPGPFLAPASWAPVSAELAA